MPGPLHLKTLQAPQTQHAQEWTPLPAPLLPPIFISVHGPTPTQSPVLEAWKSPWTTPPQPSQSSPPRSLSLSPLSVPWFHQMKVRPSSFLIWTVPPNCCCVLPPVSLFKPALHTVSWSSEKPCPADTPSGAAFFCRIQQSKLSSSGVGSAFYISDLLLKRIV